MLERFHFSDRFERLEPNVWAGLTLHVDGRPGLRVEAAGGRYIRLSLGGEPALWAEIAEDHYDYEVLRPARHSSLGVLPATSFTRSYCATSPRPRMDE